MSNFVLSAFADEIHPELRVQMDVLEKHHINFIEMRGVNGKPLVSYSLEEVRELKQQLDKKGFKLSAVGSPIGKIGISDDFEPHLELFKHTLEIAKIMECKYIRMFSFFIPQGEDPGRYRDEVIYRWQEFIKLTEASDIILLHENEKGIYGDTPERCLDLLQTLDSDYVKAVFDFANFVQCDVENYPHAYSLLKKYIVYVHVKDALYRDHSVVPAGDGDGNVSEILKELYESGFNGFLSLEPHLGDFIGFSVLEPTSPFYSLPEGGERTFAVAVQALKKVLKNIIK